MQGDQHQTKTTQQRRQREDKFVRGEPRLVSEKRYLSNGQEAPIMADVTARQEQPVMGVREVDKTIEVNIERAKIVEVVVEYPVDVIVEVPKEQYISHDIIIEKIVEVPVQKIREVEVETVFEHPVEMIIENPVYYERVVENQIKTQVMQEKEVVVVNKIPKYVTVDKEIARRLIQPVETVVVQKPVYKKVPVYQNREVEVPIYTTVDRVVEVPVDVPVDEYVVRHVDKRIPVDKVVERVVHREVDKIVEVPVDRIVEVPYEVLVTRDGRKFDTRELGHGSSRARSTTISRSHSQNILPRASGTHQAANVPQTRVQDGGQPGTILRPSSSTTQIHQRQTLPQSSSTQNLQGTNLTRNNYSTGNLLPSTVAPAPQPLTITDQRPAIQGSQSQTQGQQGQTVRYTGQPLATAGTNLYQTGAGIGQLAGHTQGTAQYNTAPAQFTAQNYGSNSTVNQGTTYYSGTNQGVQGSTTLDQPRQQVPAHTPGTTIAQQGQTIHSSGSGVARIGGYTGQSSTYQTYQPSTNIQGGGQTTSGTYQPGQTTGGQVYQPGQTSGGQIAQPGATTQYSQPQQGSHYLTSSAGTDGSPEKRDSQHHHTYQPTSRNLVPGSGNLVPTTYSSQPGGQRSGEFGQTQGQTYQQHPGTTTYTSSQNQGTQGTVYTQTAGQPQYQTSTHTYQPLVDHGRSSKEQGSYRETNDTGRVTQSPTRFDTHQPTVQYQAREPAQYQTTGTHDYSLLENLNRNLFHEPTPHQSQYQGAVTPQQGSAQGTPYLTPRGGQLQIRDLSSGQGRFQNYYPQMATIAEENSVKGSSVVKHHEIPSPFDGEMNRGGTPSPQYASRDGSVNYQLQPEVDPNRNMNQSQTEGQRIIGSGGNQVQYTSGGTTRYQPATQVNPVPAQQTPAYLPYQPLPGTVLIGQNQTSTVSGGQSYQYQQGGTQRSTDRQTAPVQPERREPQGTETNYTTRQAGQSEGTQIQTNIGGPRIGTREVIGEQRGQLPEGVLPTDRIVHYYVDKVVPKYVEEIIEKYIDVPVVREVEVPFDVIVEKVINNDKIIETQVEVTRIVEGPSIEKIVDREIEVITEIEKPIYVDKKVIKEKEVVVEKIVEVPEEKFVEIQVEKIIEFDVEVNIQNNRPVFVDKEVELTTKRRRRTSHVNENLRHSLHQSVERMNQVSKENADLKSKINILRERSNSNNSARQGRHSFSEKKREHYEDLKQQMNSLKDRISSFKNNQERTRARNSVDDQGGYLSGSIMPRYTSSQLPEVNQEIRQSNQRSPQMTPTVKDARQYTSVPIEGSSQRQTQGHQ